MAPPLIRYRAELVPRQTSAVTSQPASTASSAAPSNTSNTSPSSSTNRPSSGTSSSAPRSGSASQSQSQVSASSTIPSTTSDPTSTEATATSTPTEPPRNNNGGVPREMSTAVVAAIAVIGTILLGFVIYLLLKHLRSRYKDPKYLPGSFLKNKWRNWDTGYEVAANPTGQRAANRREINRQARSRANIEANRALDRHTSVRSVITLPPYREMAEVDLERTIGREGERDGIDTITRLPETAEEEEARREERMQAMYELRLQRRAQRAAREARQRGNGSVSSLTTIDSANGPNATSESLTGLDMETGGTGGRSASELTAVILSERQRRLSEVSYNEVGYARPDGSRVRSSSAHSNGNGNSGETPGNRNSDSIPLLSGGASMGGRSRSSSVLSVNTSINEQRPSTDRRNSAELLSGVVSSDLGEARLPPSYDVLDWGDAPPYMSPVSPVSRSNTATERGRQNLRVPLVRVTGASAPNSPMNDRQPGGL